MGKLLRNSGAVPQGMLAPNGYRDSYINPMVQATTRPGGSLLHPSPGYDTIRPGKNEFQGGARGFTGGFTPMMFAEEVGGSGAAMMISPGNVGVLHETEWLPESEDSLEVGSVLVADTVRHLKPAAVLHEGRHTPVDMGDRHPGRPLSAAALHPWAFLRTEYAENPLVTVLASIGAVLLAHVVGTDLEREFRSRRGRGVASAGSAAAVAPVATAGVETQRATNESGDAADKVIETIGQAASAAVQAIEDAGNAVKEGAAKAADAVT